jgi:hypothetical protein
VILSRLLTGSIERQGTSANDKESRAKDAWKLRRTLSPNGQLLGFDA